MRYALAILLILHGIAHLVGFVAPTALEDGEPIEGTIAITHQLFKPAPHVLLADRVHRPYTAAGLDQPDARLLVRDHPNAARREIDRARWRFARREAARKRRSSGSTPTPRCCKPRAGWPRWRSRAAMRRRSA